MVATRWIESGKFRILCWDCSCGALHPLYLHGPGKVVLTCECGSQAGFDIQA